MIDEEPGIDLDLETEVWTTFQTFRKQLVNSQVAMRDPENGILAALLTIATVSLAGQRESSYATASRKDN